VKVRSLLFIAVLLHVHLLYGCANADSEAVSVESVQQGTVLRHTGARANTRLVWITSAEDCTSCNSLAYFWRRVNAGRSRPLDLEVLVLGNDSTVIREHLRAERVHATIRLAKLGGQLHKRTFPVMLLMHDDTVRFAWVNSSSHPESSFAGLVNGAGMQSATRIVDKVSSPSHTH
jgi:hypothetical protein